MPRRNEQLEEKSVLGGVCVCVYILMHLYTDAYLLFGCLFIIMPEDSGEDHLEKQAHANPNILY